MFFEDNSVYSIFSAIREKKIEKVKEMINAKEYSINQLEDFMYEAVSESLIPIVDFLIDDKGVEINKIRENSIDGETPLHMAMYLDDSFTMAKHLISKGADINGKNVEGRTALHSTAEFDNFDGVKFLLLNGADETIRDNTGRLPSLLHRSCDRAPYAGVGINTRSTHAEEMHFKPWDYESERPSIWAPSIWERPREEEEEEQEEDEEPESFHCISLKNSPTQILLDNYRKMKISFETCVSLNCPAFTKEQVDKLKTHIRKSPQLEMLYREMRSKALMLSAFGIYTDHKIFVPDPNIGIDMLDVFGDESFGENLELFEEEKGEENYSLTDKDANEYMKGYIGGRRRKSRKSRKSKKSKKSKKSRIKGTRRSLMIPY